MANTAILTASYLENAAIDNKRGIYQARLAIDTNNTAVTIDPNNASGLAGRHCILLGFEYSYGQAHTISFISDVTTVKEYNVLGAAVRIGGPFEPLCFSAAGAPLKFKLNDSSFSAGTYNFFVAFSYDADWLIPKGR